jgi:hypothetical protein
VGDSIPSLNMKILGLPEGADYELSVDGEPVDPEIAMVPRKVDPGSHEVVVRAEGYQPVTRTVKVAERDNAEVRIEMVAEHRDAAPPADGGTDGGGDAYRFSDVPMVSWIGFGVGAAGFIMGAVAGGITLGRTGSLDDDCPGGRCPDRSDQSRIDAAKTSAHVSTAGFVIGGVGAAFGLATLLLWPDEGMLVSRGEHAPESAGVRFTLSVGSLGVSGVF